MSSIILVGFMGAGKTTVGAELAVRTKRTLRDLDATIVSLAGMSIPQIFAEKGESHFRDLETESLRRVDPSESLIVSTGGGIVERPVNWALMRARGQTVYLHAPWDVLRQRLARESGRPLANAENGWEKVEQLFLRRESLYRQADYVINTEGISARVAAEKVAGLFQSKG